jgi:hypothetical protein
MVGRLHASPPVSFLKSSRRAAASDSIAPTRGRRADASCDHPAAEEEALRRGLWLDLELLVVGIVRGLLGATLDAMTKEEASALAERLLALYLNAVDTLRG